MSSRISWRAAALGISSSSAVRSSGDISFRIADHLLVCHGAQQFLLRLDIEIFENIRRQRVRQDAKNDHLFVFRHVEDHLGHIGRRPFAKHLAQRAEIARVDQALDFRF